MVCCMADARSRVELRQGPRIQGGIRRRRCAPDALEVPPSVAGLRLRHSLRRLNARDPRGGDGCAAGQDADEVEQVGQFEHAVRGRRQGRGELLVAQDGVRAPADEADENPCDERAAQWAEALAAVVLGLGEHVVPQRGAVEEAAGLQGLLLVRRRLPDFVRGEDRETEVVRDRLAGGQAEPVAAEQVAGSQTRGESRFGVALKGVQVEEAFLSPFTSAASWGSKRRVLFTFWPSPMMRSHSMIQFSGRVSVPAPKPS